MTDLNTKREEIKKEIRSLLESAPVGLTLQEIKRDFEKFIGTPFPTKALGYNTDEEFLRDINDAVKISWRGNTMVLHAVSVAETQHLTKLINNQKLDPKKRWGVLRNANYGRPLPLLYSNNKDNGCYHGSDLLDWRASKISSNITENCDYARAKSKFSVNLNFTKPNPSSFKASPLVPPFVREQIYNVLKKSVPNGLPLIYFSAMFRKAYGSPLDAQAMGYQSEEELLRSLSDIIQLKNYGSEIRVLIKETATAVNKDDQELKCSQNYATSSKSDCKYYVLEDVPCNIPMTFQNLVRQVIQNFPQGINLSHLMGEFKATHNHDLPFKTYGYNSVIEFVSDLPHIITINRPNPLGDFILYPAELTQAEKGDISKEVKKIDEESKFVAVDESKFVAVDEITKESIIQVLSMNKNGILLDQFLDVYKEMTGKDLDVGKYCCSGLQQFLLGLSDVLSIVFLSTSGKSMVVIKEHVGVRKFDHLTSNYQPLIASNQQSIDHSYKLPADVVGPGCQYKQQTMPNCTKEDSIPMYVSYVMTPAMLWVQLRSESTSLVLEDLMDDLEKTYDFKKTNDYNIKPEMVTIGMLCAAIYPEDGFWYRALVTGIKAPFFEVKYVDYGNRCSVTINQMKFLKQKYLKFPAQAIQARLSHLKPVGQMWTPQATNRLLELSKERPLCGVVTGIKNGVVSLYLIDTNTHEDIHINDVLKQEGLGTFARDDEVTDNDQQSQVQNSELVQADSEKMKKRVYVRQVMLSDQVQVHLINFNDHPYLLSFEISNLFFKEDIIGTKMLHDGIRVDKIVVKKVDYPDLFEELMIYEVPSITDETNMLSLFSLEIFPTILKKYGRGPEFEEIEESTQNVLSWFNPQDPYWNDDCDEECASDSSRNDLDSESPSDDLPSVQDLQGALQTLVIQRKNILLKLISTQDCNPDNVNKLTEVETKIKKVADYLKTLTDESSLFHVPDNVSPEVNIAQVAPLVHGAGAEAHRLQQLPNYAAVNPMINPDMLQLQQKMLQIQLQQAAMIQNINPELLQQQQNLMMQQKLLLIQYQQLQLACNSVGLQGGNVSQSSLLNQQQHMQAMLATLSLGATPSSLFNLQQGLGSSSATPYSHFNLHQGLGSSRATPSSHFNLQQGLSSSSATPFTSLQRSQLLQFQQLSKSNI